MARHTGENENPVWAQYLENFDGHLRGSHGFIDHIDLTYLLDKLLSGVLRRRDVFRADRLRECSLRVGLERTRIDVRFEAGIHQHHGSQQTYRSSAQDHRPMAVMGGFAQTCRATPRQPLLNQVYLDQGLLCNGERLNQHPHVPQLGRQRIEVGLVIYHELRHESVALLDTALHKIPGVTEILTS